MMPIIFYTNIKKICAISQINCSTSTDIIDRKIDVYDRKIYYKLWSIKFGEVIYITESISFNNSKPNQTKLNYHPVQTTKET